MGNGLASGLAVALVLAGVALLVTRLTNLAGDNSAERRSLDIVFERRRQRTWRTVRSDIEAALLSIQQSGYCAAAWQPEVIAVAAPLKTANMAYAVNVSVLTTDPFERVVSRLGPKLLTLRDDIGVALERATDAT